MNVQLINAMTDAHLWAEIYDRKLTDIFAVESDIAKTIADTLQAKLTGKEKQRKGQPLTQKGRNGRHIRRWTSWYDNRLVTDNGEAILAKYDDWAINFFRQKRLSWSSWGRMVQFELPDHVWLAPRYSEWVRSRRSNDSLRMKIRQRDPNRWHLPASVG